MSTLSRYSTFTIVDFLKLSNVPTKSNSMLRLGQNCTKRFEPSRSPRLGPGMDMQGGRRSDCAWTRHFLGQCQQAFGGPYTASIRA